MRLAARVPGRLLLSPALVGLALSGCATQSFVEQRMDAANQRFSLLEERIAQADADLRDNIARLQAAEGRLAKAEQAAEALHTRLEATRADLLAANNNLAGLLVGLNGANQRIEDNAGRVQSAEVRLARLASESVAPAERAGEPVATPAGAEASPQGHQTTAAVAPDHGGAGRLPGTIVAARPMATAPDATPAFAEPPAGMGERLSRVGMLIDEVHRRISVNTSSLREASLRIGALESGLVAVGSQRDESESALKAAQEGIAAAQGQIASLDQRIQANTHALDQMGPHIDAAKAAIKIVASHLDSTQKQLDETREKLVRADTADTADMAGMALSETAREALKRALAAGKVAEGRLLAENVLTESIGFQPEQAGLSESARLALVAFADRLKMEGQGVYIEIQGHTDSSGSAERNMKLSRQRAEAVRDFLHQQAGIPLHRLAVAAYGESRPVADNGTDEGRIKNRRVVLVVLK